MATLTKKDLLEAIEDMPMDAPIWRWTVDGRGDRVITPLDIIKYNDIHNRIELC